MAEYAACCGYIGLSVMSFEVGNSHKEAQSDLHCTFWFLKPALLLE